MVDFLSKSSMNLYLQCPYKWKKSYIDNEKFVPSPAMKRGTRIHEKIENFYKDLEKSRKDPELSNFVKFEKKLFNNNPNPKYYQPLFQELKLSNIKLGLKGIIDAVYINPEDDEIIVIDWKSGQYYKNKLDDYRFELAVYAELLKASDKVENVKYWGICFVDQDKLFFEEVDPEYIRRMYETVDRVRENIKLEKFEPQKNNWCFNCQYKKECGV